MPPERLTTAEMIEKLTAAHKAATDALQRQWRGDAAFKVSIPARPGVDTDFLICEPIQEVIAAMSAPPPAAAEWPLKEQIQSALEHCIATLEEEGCDCGDNEPCALCEAQATLADLKKLPLPGPARRAGG